MITIHATQLSHCDGSRVSHKGPDDPPSLWPQPDYPQVAQTSFRTPHLPLNGYFQRSIQQHLLPPMWDMSHNLLSDEQFGQRQALVHLTCALHSGARH